MINQALLNDLPVAVYSVDAEGRLISFNDAAAALWGRRPDLESTCWCGSWRLFWPDGYLVEHDKHPIVRSLREEREIRGLELVAERPDGTRIPFIPYPRLLRDVSGRVTGVLAVLADVAAVTDADLQAARLAAIVACSDDAIVSKSLDGRITSWNAAATRIFGYEADEMIGRSIKTIIPRELHAEEDEILARLSRGEHIDHFDTVRLAKDGRRVSISLTVSPLRDKTGRIIGASKVARDVTDRKQSEELQRLLFAELNHRVKNTLATIQAIAAQSQRSAKDPQSFVTSFNGRMRALSRAHDLLVRGEWAGASIEDLIREQVLIGATDLHQISFSGPDVVLNPQLAVQLALVLHELATNARKHGALSRPFGQLDIMWRLEPDHELSIDWRESGVKELAPPTGQGFGSTLIERSLESSGGHADIRYAGDGIHCAMRLPLPDEDAQGLPGLPRQVPERNAEPGRKPSSVTLRGVRVLVVEDEPLIAMEIEEALTAAGCKVVGPAASLDKARARLQSDQFDIAILDANLGGDPVDELAGALGARATPFAFATGYGREALPIEFQHRPILIKPFSNSELISLVRRMVNEELS